MPKVLYSKKNMRSKAVRRKSAYGTMTKYLKPKVPKYAITPRDLLSRANGQMTTITKNKYFPAWLTTPLASGEVVQGKDFRLSDLNLDLNNLIQLYDQYKINWVTVTLIPRVSVVAQSTVALTGTSPTQIGLLVTAPDFDSSLSGTAPSLEYLMAKDYCKFTRGTAIHKVSLRPAVNTTIQTTAGGATGNFGAPQRQQWIDCGASGVPHYGLWIGCQDSDGSSIQYDMIVKYNISFRNTH